MGCAKSKEVPEVPTTNTPGRAAAAKPRNGRHAVSRVSTDALRTKQLARYLMRQRMRRGLSSDTSLTCACEPCEQAAVPAGVVAGGWTGSGMWRMDGSVAMAAAEAAWAQKLTEKKAAAAAAAAATAATDVAAAQTAAAAEVATTAASTEVVIGMVSRALVALQAVEQATAVVVELEVAAAAEKAEFELALTAEMAAAVAAAVVRAAVEAAEGEEMAPMEPGAAEVAAAEEKAAVEEKAAAEVAAVVEEAGLATAKAMAAVEEMAPNFRLKRPPPLEVRVEEVAEEAVLIKPNLVDAVRSWVYGFFSRPCDTQHPRTAPRQTRPPLPPNPPHTYQRPPLPLSLASSIRHPGTHATPSHPTPSPLTRPSP